MVETFNDLCFLIFCHKVFENVQTWDLACLSHFRVWKVDKLMPLEFVLLQVRVEKHKEPFAYLHYVCLFRLSRFLFDMLKKRLSALSIKELNMRIVSAW